MYKYLLFAFMIGWIPQVVDIFGDILGYNRRDVVIITVSIAAIVLMKYKRYAETEDIKIEKEKTL